jgi:hypothetical protein
MAANVNSKKYQFPGAAEILRESGAPRRFPFFCGCETENNPFHF